MRGFAAVSLTAAAYSLADVVLTLQLPERFIHVSSRLGIAVVGLHLVAWIYFLAAISHRRFSPLERTITVLAVCGVLMAPVPGVVFNTEGLRAHHVAWLGVRYMDVVPTAVGQALFAAYSCGYFIVLGLYVRAWRRGLPDGAIHVVCLAIMLAAGLNDALSAAGAISSPYLIDAGFVIVVSTIGGSVVRRFIGAARSLELLRGRLEVSVEERTRELAKAQGALARAEKLAAIGQLAAGVAHEINNPAAAVMGNLTYLQETEAETGAYPDDAPQCIDESMHSIRRIARIVRQLLDAGRVAGRQHGRSAPFQLLHAVQAAMSTARVGLGAVQVDVSVPEELYVKGEEELFEQVVVNVLVNAGQAAADHSPAPRVSLSVEVQAERVRLLVTDNGPGISVEAQPRLFEPFFTTKGQGRGTGLGLAVSLGLMRAQAGDLLLVSTSEKGTTMALELPKTSTLPSDQPVLTPLPKMGVRILLVDDEPAVLEGLRRSLSAQYFVEATGSVETALERLGRGRNDFDVVLCDIVMPDGGGRRLWTEIDNRFPEMAPRMIFMTAGAVSDDYAQFVEAQGPRVLRKPLDAQRLRLLISRTLKRARQASAQPGAPAT